MATWPEGRPGGLHRAAHRRGWILQEPCWRAGAAPATGFRVLPFPSTVVDVALLVARGWSRGSAPPHRRLRQGDSARWGGRGGQPEGPVVGRGCGRAERRGGQHREQIQGGELLFLSDIPRFPLCLEWNDGVVQPCVHQSCFLESPVVLVPFLCCDSATRVPPPPPPLLPMPLAPPCPHRLSPRPPVPHTEPPRRRPRPRQEQGPPKHSPAWHPLPRRVRRSTWPRRCGSSPRCSPSR